MDGFSKCIIVFSGPSGSGKTTIIDFLIKRIPQLEFVVSATTRPIRKGEQEGKNYYFISPQQFERQKEEGRFLEWEKVYQNVYYGTYASEINRIHALRHIPILDLDVQGGLNIKNIYQERCLSLFIYVPQVRDLKKRLLSRGMPDDEKLVERLQKAEIELQHRAKFDRVINNTFIKHACLEAEQIARQFSSQHITSH